MDHFFWGTREKVTHHLGIDFVERGSRENEDLVAGFFRNIVELLSDFFEAVTGMLLERLLSMPRKIVALDRRLVR